MAQSKRNSAGGQQNRKPVQQKQAEQKMVDEDVVPVVTPNADVVGTQAASEVEEVELIVGEGQTINPTEFQEDEGPHYGSSPAHAAHPDFLENPPYQHYVGDAPQVGTVVPEDALVEHDYKPVDENTANHQWQAHTEEPEPDGRVLGPREALTFEGQDTGTVVTVMEDTYRRVYSAGAKRPSFVLLFKAGQAVSKTNVERINLNALSNSDDEV